MSYTDNLWLFLVLIAGIIIVPGMDMLYVLVSALSGGRRAGLVATSGMMAGGVVHTLYGTLGTGLLLSLAPRLFTPILIAGALYMIWIGWTLVRSVITVDAVERMDKGALWQTFRRAVATCLLNPKAYLFVIAVYPQFLKPAYGPIWLQGLALGVMTVATQALVYGGVALAADRARTTLTGNPAATIWVGRVAGGLLIAAAALTLWHGLSAS